MQETCHIMLITYKIKLKISIQILQENKEKPEKLMKMMIDQSTCIKDI